MDDIETQQNRQEAAGLTWTGRFPIRGRFGSPTLTWPLNNGHRAGWVYRLYLDDQLVYIGETAWLLSRLRQHGEPRSPLHRRGIQFNRWSAQLVLRGRTIAEAALIRDLQPIGNRR